MAAATGVGAAMREACAKKLSGRGVSGLGFKKRAEIALGDKNSPALQGLMAHYRMRNRIAHGDLPAESIELVRIVTEFYTMQAEL